MASRSANEAESSHFRWPHKLSEKETERQRYLILPMPLNHRRLRQVFEDGDVDYNAKRPARIVEPNAPGSQLSDLKIPRKNEVNLVTNEYQMPSAAKKTHSSSSNALGFRSSSSAYNAVAKEPHVASGRQSSSLQKNISTEASPRLASSKARFPSFSSKAFYSSLDKNSDASVSSLRSDPASKENRGSINEIEAKSSSGFTQPRPPIIRSTLPPATSAPPSDQAGANKDGSRNPAPTPASSSVENTNNARLPRLRSLLPPSTSAQPSAQSENDKIRSGSAAAAPASSSVKKGKQPGAPVLRSLPAPQASAPTSDQSEDGKRSCQNALAPVSASGKKSKQPRGMKLRSQVPKAGSVPRAEGREE